MEGKGDRASCPSCGSSYRRRARGVEERGSGERTLHSVAALVEAIQRHGGALTAAGGPDGPLAYEAAALFHGFVREEAVQDERGRLLGFVERPGEGRLGSLRLDDKTLSFQSDSERHVWALEDITALQVSTRSLQVGVRHRGTLQLTLTLDSTYRWEALLQHVIRRRWNEEGWGEITEFQPRITGR